MSKVSFHYNFKRDAWSWVCFAKRRNNIWGLKQRLDFIPPNLLKEIRKRNKKTAEKLVYNYLINNPKKTNPQNIHKTRNKCFTEYLAEIGKQIF